MKRRVYSLFTAITLLLCVVIHASATTPHVIDQAGLLSGNECQDLEATAEQLVQEYAMDVVILTVTDTGGKSAQAFADDYYDEYAFGVGPEADGLLLLLDMGARQWHITTCGNAISAFTDYGLDQLSQEFVPLLSEGDYYGAFKQFLSDLPQYFDAYYQGAPIDIVEAEESVSLFFSLVIGLIAATVAILIMRGSMNTKRYKQSASDYAKQGSFSLTKRQDLFLYSNVSKTRRQESSSSGSKGGSSVHRSSSGRSHGGRGGRF